MKLFVPTAAVFAALACIAPLASANQAARNPRLEKLALTPADTKLAKSETVELADLGSGWKGGQVSAGNNETPDCPWQDYSPYTLTGQGESVFALGQSAQVIAQAGVFPTSGQAAGDYAVGTKTGTAACEGASLGKAVGKAAKVVVAKQVAAPKVGDRATAYTFTIKNAATTFHVDIILVERGRSLGAVSVVTTAAKPVTSLAHLAALMDARMQKA